MALRQPKGITAPKAVVPPPTTIFWCTSCNHSLGQHIRVCPICKKGGEQRSVVLCIGCSGTGWNSKRGRCYPCEGTGLRDPKDRK